MSSNAERAFVTRWYQLGGRPLSAEHRFAPPRRWRFDFADLIAMVAVEVDGGAYSGGRHTRGAGFEADCEKLNTAALLGWTVFRVTPGMIDRNPAGVLGPMIEFCKQRVGGAP